MKKRTLCLLLCALFLSSSFTACSDQKPASDDDVPASENGTSVEETVPEETQPEETEPVRDSADLPEKNLDGYTFRILARQDWNPTGSGCTLIVPEEMTGEELNDLVFERNAAIMDKYNIEYSWTVILEANNVISQAVNGDLDEYDLVSLLPNEGNKGAMNGLYRDLYTIPYLDLTKNYWDQNMRRELSVNGKYYTICGDITFAEEEGAMLTMYNKPMADAYGIENLYDLARAGGWTIDKMQEYATKVINDADGNGTFDHENDVYGFLYHSNSALLPYLAAADTHIVTKDENDIPVLTGDLSKVENVYTIMQQLFSATGMAIDWGTLPSPVPNMCAMIENQRVLFQNMVSSFLRRNYRDVETDFGILPMPKFDEAQETYTTSYNMLAMMCEFVPVTAKNIENIGIILEAMCDASYALTDTYYNVCLNSKFTRDQESFEMIKLATENIVLDSAFIYDFGNIGSTLNTSLLNGEPFASTYKSVEKAAGITIKKFANGEG